MADNSEKKAQQSLWNSRVALLTVLVLVGLSMALFGDKGVVRLHHVRRQQQQLGEQLRQLEAVNDGLKQQLDALQHDDRYIERVARTRLGLVREGEFVYQFTDSAR